MYSIRKSIIKLKILILLLNNIFEYIYNIIRITKLIILLLLNLLQTTILVNLLNFFFATKIYLLQLDLKLLKKISNNNILETCCNIKNINKIIKKIKILQNFFY